MTGEQKDQVIKIAVDRLKSTLLICDKYGLDRTYANIKEDLERIHSIMSPTLPHKLTTQIARKDRNCDECGKSITVNELFYMDENHNELCKQCGDVELVTMWHKGEIK